MSAAAPPPQCGFSTAYSAVSVRVSGGDSRAVRAAATAVRYFARASATCGLRASAADSSSAAVQVALGGFSSSRRASSAAGNACGFTGAGT